MAIPAENAHITTNQEVTVPVMDSKTQVCRQCSGSGWVKTFTPWGCPSSAPCSCNKSQSASKSAK